MLTLKALRNAVGYSENHLEYSDYLDERNKVQGTWMGQAAAQLGMSGNVRNGDFERLRACEHPETGEFLRQRRSADRMAADGSKQSSAVALYDLTFSAPKSVSIMAILGGDKRLLEAHERAVAAALKEAESYATVEDQRKKQKITHQTGNLAMAVYTHQSSRSLDPQLHSHSVIFNLSYDEKSGQWKALDSRGLYQRRALLTEIYRNELAREVTKLGYEIEDRWNDRGTDRTFEIKAVSRELCKKFSKRSAEKEAAIDQFIAKQGRQPSDNEVAMLVRKTRDPKLKEISTEEVHQHQRSQLTAKEKELLKSTRQKAEQSRSVHAKSSAVNSLAFAVEHLFERVSVAHEHQLLEQALQHGRGRVRLDELKTELQFQKYSGALIEAGGQVTTKEALIRERNMIAAINLGNGRHSRLGGEMTFHPDGDLSSKQQKAVAFILGSKDFAVCLQGAAGTGKTATLREIDRGLTEAGRGVTAVAPTQAAVGELRQCGFRNAMTISRLLADPKMQETIAGKVVIVDEAGMVSGQQMFDLLHLIEKNGGRLILVGDTQQIKSVEASDALRILQKESKLKTATLSEVVRQTEPKYQAAAKTLWEDRAKGFRMLQEMGAVKEVDYFERPQATVEAFLAAKREPNVQGKERTVLVISPTHEEIGRYNEAIRHHLKMEGKLNGGKKIERLEPLNWTLAERKEARRYQPGQVLVFHKAVANASRNEAVTVVRTEGSRIVCRDRRGNEVTFTGKQAGAFNVFMKQEIEIAPGDQLLLQANLKQRGLEVTNGDVAVVKQVDEKGRIHLQDGRVLPAWYRQFKHGYAMTAHRSQGKTADAVIVSADQMNGDLFYVAASRGREQVQILTSDLALLRQSVTHDGNRLSAIELNNQAAEETEKKQWEERRRRTEHQRQLFASKREQKRTHEFVISSLENHSLLMRTGEHGNR